MNTEQLLLLADLVLVAHAVLALFLALGLVALLMGGPLDWGWVRGRAFRVAHLCGMAVVAAEALLGIACPLTEFESALRSAAQAPAYGQSFIAHWLGRLLFYDFDEAVFAGAYLLGLGVTVWAWRRWPVRKKNSGEGGRG